MRVTNARGAGMVPDRHHVLPQEHITWFQDHGFPGDDIDNFTVELSEGIHQALHGGGNYRLARQKWNRHWNNEVMYQLQLAEDRAGRRLTRNEVLSTVKRVMKRFGIGDQPFVHYEAAR